MWMERIWVHAWPAVCVFQPFHVDTDALLHDEYLVESLSQVRSVPACSPRGHVVSHTVSEASRFAEEVLSQEVQVHLSVRRILPFSLSLMSCVSQDRVSLVTPNFTWVFLLLDIVLWSRRTATRVITEALS